MIIILPAIKDTYVTNLKTKNIDAITSNVGNASTLDLFKLYNENKNACSSAVITFVGEGKAIASSGEEFVLKDSLGNSVIFKTDITVNTQNGDIDVNGKVIIGLLDTVDNIEVSSDPVKSGYAEVFSNVINGVTSNNNGLTLEISAFSNSNNELVLKQNNPGVSGDTNISLDANIDYASVSSNESNSFARKEISAILLNFDIKEFKSEFMNNVADFNLSAFNDLKAEIILYDVTTGQTKPRNYTLSAFNLTKDFEEGVGKDTIYYSDKSEVANFTNLNSNIAENSFKIPGYVSFIDDTSILDHKVNINDLSTPICQVNIGNEDAVFDITEYFKNQIDATLDHKGVLITFDNSEMNNEKTYFVKRFGSRHLINKSLVPILKISVPDSDFTIPKKSQFSKRYLDSEETFYLFNRSNKRLTNFNNPNAGVLKFRILSSDKKTTYVDNIATSDAKNYKGNKLDGIKKATILSDHLSRFSSDLTNSSNLEKTTYKKNSKGNFYFLDPDNLSAVDAALPQNDPENQPLLIQDINDSNFFINNKKGKYDVNDNVIEDDLNVNEQAFPVIDDVVSSNIVNINNDLIKNNKLETFINWYWESGTEEYVVLEEKVDFSLSENSDDQTYSNLVSRVKFENTSLNGDNTINEGHVYFLDTRSSLEVVKVPFDILSENLGEVTYQLINVDNKKILYNYGDSTKLFFDGEKYVFNFCLPEIYKHFRVKFNFKVNNQIIDSSYIIKNKEIFRVE
jgi:hypothetical protein